MLGGGMRQAGVLAAAGNVALNTMIDRLAEDHVNAKRLASELSLIESITIAQKNVQTNIVLFTVAPELSAAKFIAKLNEQGLKISPRGGNLFRAVTHRMISENDVDEALSRIKSVISQLKSAGG